MMLDTINYVGGAWAANLNEAVLWWPFALIMALVGIGIFQWLTQSFEEWWASD